MTSTYSPDAIKTWANAVTVARVLVAPILFVMIDGIVQVPDDLTVGGIHRVDIVDALGPDLIAVPAA